MLLYRFLIEGNRLFKTKWYLGFIILIAFIGGYFVSTSAIEYKNILKEKNLYLTQKQDPPTNYTDSQQKGNIQYKILYYPSPLYIFYSNSNLFESLSSEISTEKILKINSSYSGRNPLPKKGFYNDISGLFLLFGSLLFIHLGMTAFKSEKYFFRFGNSIIRLVTLNLYFIILLLLLYQLPRLFSLSLSGLDKIMFFHYSIYLLSTLNFFYSAGLLIRVLIKKKNISYIYAFIFWFCSIILIPDLMSLYLHEKVKKLPNNETYNLVQLENVVNFEQQLQQSLLKPSTETKIDKRNRCSSPEDIYLINNKKKHSEENFKHNIQQIIYFHETSTLLFPTCFYKYLSSEISGYGYQGYSELVDQTIKLQTNVINENHNNKTNKSSIKPSKETDIIIFYGNSFLPHSFWMAFALSTFYIIAFFSLAYGVLKRRKEKVPKTIKPDYNFRSGNTYFILCKDDQYRENLFQHYQSEPNVIGIDRIKADEIDLGIDFQQLVNYLCKLSGIKSETVLDYLTRFGKDIPDSKEDFLQKTGEPISEEILYKLYCTISFAGAQNIVVINDFLKRKSREIERYFLDFLAYLNSQGKIIIYLSSEIFLASLPYKGNIKIDSYKNFKIDPKAVSLR